MLTSTQLTRARAIAVGRLASRCTVRRVDDTDGAQTWPISAGNVPCQVGYPRQGGAMGMVDRLGNDPGVVIWVSVDTEVQSGGRVEVGDVIYEIAFVPPLRSQDLLRGLTCIEIRSPGVVT